MGAGGEGGEREGAQSKGKLSQFLTCQSRHSQNAPRETHLTNKAVGQKAPLNV